MAFILFTGGIRSGKSRLAQAWAEAAAPERLLLATRPSDGAGAGSMIEKKKQAEWSCLNEPLEPLEALKSWQEQRPDFNGSFVLDSLGMLIMNLMTQNLPAPAIRKRIRALAEDLASPDYSCAVVTEEYGAGHHPVDPIARKYAELLGAANQYMAKKAHAVILVCCGLPLALKGVVPAVLDRYSSAL